jgi:site-specific recombinase XerD
MRILFSGGVRLGEIARINLNDIRENGIFVHSEKGEAETIAGLSDDAMNAIRNYNSSIERQLIQRLFSPQKQEY